MKRICVQWSRFGPYHLARLTASHRLFQQHGVEVVGLETAGQDATYAWKEERGPTAFRREQVFPGKTFEHLSPTAVHTGIVRALDRIDPDAVAITSYSTPDARACLAWCKRHRRRAVLMTASKEDDALRISWRESLKAVLVHLYDAALVGGARQQEYLEKLGFPPGYIFQGYNAVDNAYFCREAEAARRNPGTCRALPGLANPAPFFLASNRFIAIKNLDGLLKAYRGYRDRTEAPWRLLLLGDGPERPRLEALVAAESIEGVVFCGFRQFEELPAYYGLAGAFVHPAFKDTWGLVVNEAMATGLPVLVSERAGCTSDLIAHAENGYAFDPENLEQLTQLMVRLASPDADRAAMGRRSSEIIRNWSPERFAENLWRAVEAAGDRVNRPVRPLGRTLLWTLRYAARNVTSFQSVKDV